MVDFDDDPLDLLEDDGDGVNEMCLLLDDEEPAKTGGRQPSGNGGCCIIFMAVGSSLVAAGWGIYTIIT
jgi:hypothetical protein